MDCNDINRRVRYALMIDDDEVIDLMRLTAFTADRSAVSGWRLKMGEPGYVPCPPDALRRMLDGLIIRRRGVKDKPAGATGSAPDDNMENIPGKPQILDNNDVLKQLRIALSLRTDAVHALISEGGGKLGKSEVNALFRSATARNYRRCGDQVLRWFLTGLAARRQSGEMQ